MHRLPALALSVLAVACSSTPDHERAFLPRPEEEWISRAFDRSPDGDGRVVESIPADESFDLWTRMITIQFIEGSEATPHEMMERILGRLRAKCPELVSDVIREDEQGVVYEWRIDACPAAPDQHEVARVFAGAEGLHRVAYVQKGPLMPDDVRAAWIERLSEAILIKGKDLVQAPPEPYSDAARPAE
jgi:hypothetical protein